MKKINLILAITLFSCLPFLSLFAQDAPSEPAESGLFVWAAAIVAALLAIDKVIQLIPSMKSNGVREFISNLLMNASKLLQGKK